VVVTTAPSDADDALVADLAAALDASRVHTGALELGLYGRDASLLRGDAGPVCFPRTAGEVQAVVRVAARHGRSIVPRGSGTGLAGGAVPVDRPVMIVTTQMNRIRSVDAEAQVAWVEPGVVNLDLSRHVAPLGLAFAPDPSSQQACSIGGNVANNSGGPHCLLHGVTSAHVLAIEAVLPDGELVVLGGLEPDPPGYDLRGAFVGSEGTMGIATAVAVRLIRRPPAVATMLLDFADVADAAATVSAVIAHGIVPGAIEMMDQRITAAVEEFVHAGFPVDAAAVLLIELEGMPRGVAEQQAEVARIGRDNGAHGVVVASDERHRELLWKGRKAAFGAVARVAPNYYLHDTVVPRTRLVEVLAEVYAIADRHGLLVMNVFHAGDGNLHPLLLFDAREPGVLDRVHAAGAEIVAASLAAGGVLSGEHGIGLEKRDYMPLLFSDVDLAAQAALRGAFDPHGRANPQKVLPSGAGCGDLQAVPEGLWV
jgi:glycolate oxidase